MVHSCGKFAEHSKSTGKNHIYFCKNCKKRMYVPLDNPLANSESHHGKKNSIRKDKREDPEISEFRQLLGHLINRLRDKRDGKITEI